LLLSLHKSATISIGRYFQDLSTIASTDIEFAATAEPVELRHHWPQLVAKYPPNSLSALRGLLSFLCEVRFLSWTPLHSRFVSSAFYVPQRDPYAGIRSGDAFLTIGEEAKLVRWMDKQALLAQTLDYAAAAVACLVVSSYQFGMRPKQLGMLRNRDYKGRTSREDGSAIVHLTFRLIKQKSQTKSATALHRKVKREWAPLFVRLWDLKIHEPADSFFFAFPSRAALSAALIAQLAEILQGDKQRVAYDLRHSMAQRLVDSGAGDEELAAALGHTILSTGLVYFRHSATQAEIVNKALGLSEIYREVARISKRKYISPKELAELKGDQQIAGAPHGIPIAGIGGCETGQPSCPYNPVTACYGCDKFMPVHDIKLHEWVLAELRVVVNEFRMVSRDEPSTPAYLQLRRTISEIQDVILDLEGTDEK
jgi:integrase